MRQNDVLIITNNPLVQNINDVEICKVEGSCEAVYYKTLSMVGIGHKLLSHPLAGSVKPNQNPYRSILVSKRPVEADMHDLKIMEQCLEKVEVMATEETRADLKIKYAEDFQLVDKELILGALNEILER